MKAIQAAASSSGGLTGFLDPMVRWLTDAMQAGGLWALAGFMLAENLFPPIPSEGILPLAGFVVTQGGMGLLPALAAATFGSVVGALLLYALGRWGGRPVLLRWHRILRVDERQLDRADAWFDAHGPKLVFWCRMLPLARSVISIPAGASEMPIVRFLVLTTLGSLLWNGLLIGAGMLVGDNYAQVSELVDRFSSVVLLLLAVACLAAFVFWRRRRRVSA